MQAGTTGQSHSCRNYEKCLALTIIAGVIGLKVNRQRATRNLTNVFKNSTKIMMPVTVRHELLLSCSLKESAAARTGLHGKCNNLDYAACTNRV